MISSTVSLPGGGALHYEVHGDRGDWLVVLNGAMQTTLAWAEVVPALARWFRVVLLDFRDQGQSSPRAPGYTVDDQAADVLALLDHLGAERAHVAGISYGGAVALALARDCGHRIHRLVLSSTTPRPTPYLLAVGDAWEAAAERGRAAELFELASLTAYSDAFHARHAAVLAQRKPLFEALATPAWLRAFLRIARSARDFDFTGALPDIRVPTLLLCGSDDRLTPAADMRAMAGRMPHAVALTVPGAGHALPVEQPVAFTAAVLGFLALPAVG